MALTTTVTLSGTTYGGVPFSHSQSGISLPQDATYKDGTKYTQAVTTSYATISWGAIADNTKCCVILTNKSATDGNDLLVSVDGTNEGLRIPPGQTACIWIKATSTQKTNFKVKMATGADTAEVTAIASNYV